MSGVWSRQPLGVDGQAGAAEGKGRKGLGLGLIVPHCSLSGSWFCSPGPPYCASFTMSRTPCALVFAPEKWDLRAGIPFEGI